MRRATMRGVGGAGDLEKVPAPGDAGQYRAVPDEES
jgi:hypothetical protein